MGTSGNRTAGVFSLLGALLTEAPDEDHTRAGEVPVSGADDRIWYENVKSNNNSNNHAGKTRLDLTHRSPYGYNHTQLADANVTVHDAATPFENLNYYNTNTSAYNSTDYNNDSHPHHQGSTQFADLPQGGTTVGTLGGAPHGGSSSGGHSFPVDKGGGGGSVGGGGNSVFLPEVGYVQTPTNLTAGLLPHPPQYRESHETADTLFESLSPQVTLDSISRGTGGSTGPNLLNGSTALEELWSDSFSTGNIYYNNNDNNITSVFDGNLSSLFNNISADNATVAYVPDGYLSGYSTEHVILTSVFVTLLMIVIIVGNGLVVLAICIDRNLKAIQNWFIASLAVSDLLVGLLIMPFSLANELMGYWYFGNILCELWLATDVLLCTASIMNLCLISLDRFWSITRAISYVKQRTKKRAVLMIALVWILSMIICFPPLVGWKRPQPMKYDKPLCVLSEDIGYVVYSTLGSFYIPLVVMVVVYVKIYLAARSRARRGLKKAAAKLQQQQQQQQQQQEKEKCPSMVNDNGKSTSTATNTTTSFSTPTRSGDKTGKTNNLLVDREFSSFDENCEEALKEEMDEGVGECGVSDGGMSGGNQSDNQLLEREDLMKDNTLRSQMLAVPNQNVHHTHALDEKKKLLSECESDSACESPVRAPMSLKKISSKHIHFSEDTDSTSDSPSGRISSSSKKFNGYRHHGARSRSSVTEENMKPLLEDSQLESDSQMRDSECGGDTTKLNVQNNNLMGDNKADSEHRKDSNTGTTHAQEEHPTVPTTEDLSSGQENSGEQLNNEHDLRQHHHQRNNKKPIVLTPAAFSRLNLQMRKNKLDSREKHKRLIDDPEKQKRRIARAKERRAFIVLGIIMATFILSWLPFFSTYLISSLTGCSVPGLVFAIFFWAGYCNSALNPVTYTIFNRDFRQAFSKILFGRRSWS